MMLVAPVLRIIALALSTTQTLNIMRGYHVYAQQRYNVSVMRNGKSFPRNGRSLA